MNPELKRLFDEDQADRQPPLDLDGVAARDQLRRERAEQILEDGEVRAAVDFYHVAMLFQHGSATADYQRAHDLAMRAVALDPAHAKARWLAAAAKDRELVSLGQPQRYGTQYAVDTNGHWSFSPTDPETTDEERAKWNVPPLAEALRRVDVENGRKP